MSTSKMSTSKMEYEAARIRMALENGYLPSLKEVVQQVAKANAGLTLKRAGIVESVAKRMGVAVDESISGAVSNALRDLAEEGIVAPARRHGYWVMCR